MLLAVRHWLQPRPLRHRVAVSFFAARREVVFRCNARRRSYESRILTESQTFNRHLCCATAISTSSVVVREPLSVSHAIHARRPSGCTEVTSLRPMKPLLPISGSIIQTCASITFEPGTAGLSKPWENRSGQQACRDRRWQCDRTTRSASFHVYAS